MFVVELIASSFLDLISKQARGECRCKRVLVLYFLRLVLRGIFVSSVLFKKQEFKTSFPSFVQVY